VQTAQGIADPRLGSLVGKYKIERLLGKGGMGAVYEARHVQLARRVAVKFMLPQYASEPRILRRFENEARAAGRLEHANVVAVTDLGRANDGSPYLVMEFLEGEDCAQLLRRVDSLPVSRAADILAQACRGLAAAHSAGIVHRDIKPENLFLARAGDGADWVKVLDFGIAKLRDPETDALTRTGAVFGTALYMSPEQSRGDSSIDERSDVWSLGVVLYQLLSGRRPFEGRYSFEVTNQVLNANPLPLKQHRPELPDSLLALVEQALRKDASARPQSVTAFAEALAPFIDTEPLQVNPPHADGRLTDQRSRKPVPAETVSLEVSAVRPAVAETPLPSSSASAIAPSASIKVVDVLELHADRRRAGVPTVSLLRGPLTSARARFFEWADGSRLDVNIARSEGGVDLFNQWLAASSSTRLRARAVALVGAAAQVSTALVNRLIDTPSRDAELVFRRAAECGEQEALACWMLGYHVQPATDLVTAFGSLIAGVPSQSWLVIVDAASQRTAGQLRTLVRLSERFPAVTVAVAMTDIAFHSLLGKGSLRWQALLLEGQIRVPSAEHVQEPTGLSPTVRAARSDLINGGISPAVLREFDAIATGNFAGKPRSADEKFLYSILAEHAETCGWFVLNRPLSFKFGRKSAEVDICSIRLRIAIEVDGTFHRTPEAQARDRKKDELLRQHGYTVLRVVTERLRTGLTAVIEEILLTVREKKRKLWEIQA
jgi:serine/threonine protein kinase/very-short-patch-repair endonuclease